MVSGSLYERYKEALRRGHVAALRGRLDAALDAYGEAASNTLAVARRCTLELPLGKTLLPRYQPIPEGLDADSYLKELCEKGLRERYPEPTREAHERLAMELDVIRETGFAAYFLIVWDFIRAARCDGVKVGPGRGSAAGSLVAYVLRITNICPLRYVLIFKNHGAQAGATLEHSHTQLIATPIIPRILQEELDGSRRYYELKERCVFCDIVQQETADNNARRVVATSERFVALAPFAPRFPFETWILPRRHDAAFQSVAEEGEFEDLAALFKEVLQRLNLALERPPYNFVIHTAPVSDGDLEHYHWHIEIMPKLTRVAGFEIGSGFYINPTPPEDAAQYLRDIVVPA